MMRKLLHTVSLVDVEQVEDSVLLKMTLRKGRIWWSAGDAVAGFVFRMK